MTRVATGAGLILLVLVSIWRLTPVYLLGLAEITLVLAFLEYAALAERLGARIPRAASLTAAAAACAAVGWAGAAVDLVLVTSTIAIAVLVLGSGRASADALHDVTAAAFAPLYLGLSLGALVAIRAVFGREPVLLLMFTVIVSDTAQYYTGRLLGRHALAPGISPKKTVEGAAGGLVAGAAFAAIAGQWWLGAVSLPWRIALGALIVLLGIAGDLFESLLKRSAGVKDSSGLIPGHGGVLDRIDALLFAAPIYYAVLRLGA